MKTEIELGIRSFIDAVLDSRKQSLDDFDETRILESSFNRLFLAVEHLTNALVLKETGNLSKKHFGNQAILKKLTEKGKIDFPNIYKTTYNFRSYADYRKFPELEEDFNRANLLEKIDSVKILVNFCTEVFKELDNYQALKEHIKKVWFEEKKLKDNSNMDKNTNQ